MSNSRILCASIVLSLAFVGCAKKGEMPDPESSNSATDESGMGSTETSAEATQPAEASPTWEAPAPATPPPAETAAAPTLTDEQICMITDKVDEGEIEQAKLAQKKAKNPRVKKFAAQMISHHTKSKKKGATLAKTNKLTAAESSVATDLQGKATEHLETLKAAEATDFDRAYTEGQISQHQAVLELINTQLIPSATHPDLKAQLEEARGMVEGHLTEAKEIQTALMNPEASKAPGKADPAPGGMKGTPGAAKKSTTTMGTTGTAPAAPTDTK